MKARRLWIALGLCACGAGSGPVAGYRPGIATDHWCRLGPGTYAFMPVPAVERQLVGVGDECGRGARPQPKAPAPSTPPSPSASPSPRWAEDLPAERKTPSTLAELVVAPGASIEIPVRLPPRLRGTGCRIESVVIAHGRDAADLAIDIADPSGGKPIVSYQQLPPPADRDDVMRIVRDHDGAVPGVWSPDRKPPLSSMRVADPELWPTGAVLKFDGRTDGAGFATVVFEIPKDREAPPVPSRAEPKTPPADPGALPPGPPLGPPPGPPPGPSGSPYPPVPPPGPPSGPSGPSDPYAEGPPPAEGTPADGPSAEELPPYPQPKPLELIAYRHSIGIAAADSLSIVLRARARPFGVGVRSGRESKDPPLSYRPPGAAEPMQTHLVAQVAVIVSRCGRPLSDVLSNIY